MTSLGFHVVQFFILEKTHILINLEILSCIENNCTQVYQYETLCHVNKPSTADGHWNTEHIHKK